MQIGWTSVLVSTGIITDTGGHDAWKLARGWTQSVRLIGGIKRRETPRRVPINYSNYVGDIECIKSFPLPGGGLSAKD